MPRPWFQALNIDSSRPEPDLRPFRLQRLDLLQEGPERRRGIELLVLGHAGELDVQDVVPHALLDLAPVLDRRQRGRQVLSLGFELFPHRQDFRFEDLLEAGGFFLSKPQNDGVRLGHGDLLMLNCWLRLSEPGGFISGPGFYRLISIFEALLLVAGSYCLVLTG